MALPAGRGSHRRDFNYPLLPDSLQPFPPPFHHRLYPKIDSTIFRVTDLISLSSQLVNKFLLRSSRLNHLRISYGRRIDQGNPPIQLIILQLHWQEPLRNHSPTNRQEKYALTLRKAFSFSKRIPRPSLSFPTFPLSSAGSPR